METAIINGYHHQSIGSTEYRWTHCRNPWCLIITYRGCCSQCPSKQWHNGFILRMAASITEHLGMGWNQKNVYDWIPYEKGMNLPIMEHWWFRDGNEHPSIPAISAYQGTTLWRSRCCSRRSSCCIASCHFASENLQERKEAKGRGSKSMDLMWNNLVN